SFIATIREQTAALQSMIQDLLDITRLEGQHLTIDAIPMLATDAVNAAAESLRGTAEQHGLRFRVELGNLETARVLVDPVRLQQVLANLIGNAVKFTGEEGEVALLGGKTATHVRFAISDTGRGIPREALPHIFEKFYQVESGDTRIAGGAGLGL